MTARALRPRLVLHFDVNQTILASDPAGSMTLPEALNKAIAHFAVIEPRAGASVESTRETDWQWHNGVPVGATSEDGSHPPLFGGEQRLGARQRRFGDAFHWHARRFVSTEWGGVYRPLYDQLVAQLHWRHDSSADGARHLVADYAPRADDDSALPYRHYHLLVPAFFHTLVRLHDDGWPFRVFLRTMGVDLPALTDALDAFSAGVHPMWPHVGSAERPAAWARMSTPRHYYQLNRQAGGLLHPLTGQPVDDEQLLPFFEEEAAHSSCIVGVQDDYQTWRQAGYSPAAGKPVWYTHQTRHQLLHIFFDDNIHYKTDDSIVSLRARDAPDQPFRVLTGEEALAFHDVVLVKVSIVDALRDVDYFLAKIERAVNALSHFTYPLALA